MLGSQVSPALISFLTFLVLLRVPRAVGFGRIIARIETGEFDVCGVFEVVGRDRFCIGMCSWTGDCKQREQCDKIDDDEGGAHCK